MHRITVTSMTDRNGVLELSLSLGTDSANQEVQVTVEPISPSSLTGDQLRQAILDTAGKWQGDFEWPEQGDYEQREALS